MARFSGDHVNMDGSDTLGERYTMPALAVKREGSSKMKKSVLVNLGEVARAVGRPAELLLAHLGHSVSAATKAERGGAGAYVAGHHDAGVLQQQVVVFVRQYVMCKHCNKPETSCGVEGSKKRKVVFLACKVCGGRTDLESDDRLVRHMAQHLPAEARRSHAAADAGAGVMADVGRLADAAQVQDPMRDEAPAGRRRCPNPDCRHKTSKPVCKRCGERIEDAVGVADPKGGDDAGGRRDGRAPAEASADDSAATAPGDPPRDRLRAVVAALAGRVIAACGGAGRALQPAEISERAGPLVEPCGPLVDELLARIGREAGVEVTVAALRAAVAEDAASEAAKDSVVIGVLLALRGLDDVVSDTDLLSACRKLPAQSPAMRQFARFLESVDDDCEEGDGTDDEIRGAAAA